MGWFNQRIRHTGEVEKYLKKSKRRYDNICETVVPQKIDEVLDELANSEKQLKEVVKPLQRRVEKMDEFREKTVTREEFINDLWSPGKNEQRTYRDLYERTSTIFFGRNDDWSATRSSLRNEKELRTALEVHYENTMNQLKEIREKLDNLADNSIEEKKKASKLMLEANESLSNREEDLEEARADLKDFFNDVQHLVVKLEKFFKEHQNTENIPVTDSTEANKFRDELANESNHLDDVHREWSDVMKQLLKKFDMINRKL